MQINRSQAGAAITITKQGKTDLFLSKGQIQSHSKHYQFVIKNEQLRSLWLAFIESTDYCIGHQSSYKTMHDHRKTFLNQFAI